jgi:hypothetical protein
MAVFMSNEIPGSRPRGFTHRSGIVEAEELGGGVP